MLQFQNVTHLKSMNLCSREKEGAPTLWDSMDGTGEHYAKWNKPGGERQIPYDLTYKWNLINKTNKQAKYKQKQFYIYRHNGNIVQRIPNIPHTIFCY